MSEGFILLYRELIKKPIWLLSTAEQKAVLITILLLANHEERQWEWAGQTFKVLPGQFVTSLASLAEKAGKGISIQNVRSALNRFKKLQFLTYQSTKSGRLVTILNWEQYQPKPNTTQQRRQQTGNKGPTTNNNETIDIFLRRYPRQEIVRDTIAALKTTRKCGKIADSVIIAQFEKWEQYPPEQVEAAMAIYLKGKYAAHGKSEAYLWGIIRNQGTQGPAQPAPDQPPQPRTYAQAKDLESRQAALAIKQMQEKLNAGPDHTGADQTQRLLQ